MAFKFFDNAIINGAQPMPDEMYREQQQQYILEQWDNTSALVTVQEQQGLGSDEYKCLEVWIDSTIADTTTGQKLPYDFNKIVFKDINHTTMWGLMYKFENNYWIVHSYTPWDGVVQSCGIRRCNNRLKIIDPENGAIFSVPCVVNYDMAASSLKVSRYINTPSNHATVMVQGNEDTLRLFKTNTRYMLSGRPFKLLGYQNAVEHDLTLQHDTLLYLELYLDELHDGDDIVTGVADNGKYEYSLNISEDIQAIKSATGKINTTVLLNGNEVSRDIVWDYDNTIINIADDGSYTIVGNVGNKTTITAYLKGNPDVNAQCVVEVVETSADVWSIDTEPEISIIKQYESIDVTYTLYKNNVKQDNITVGINVNSDNISITSMGVNTYKFTGVKISSEPVEYSIEAKDINGDIVYTETKSIAVTSMLGG